MDANGPTAPDEEGHELDPKVYPASPRGSAGRSGAAGSGAVRGPSLVEVAVASVAALLSRARNLSRSDVPLPMAVAIGLAFGVLGGLLLISS